MPLSDKSQMRKWFLTALAVLLLALSVAVMVTGFSSTAVIRIAFGLSGVLLFCLSLLILAGIFVPSSLCIVVAHYFNAVMFFYNLILFIAILVVLIAGSGETKATSDGKEERTAVIGIDAAVECFICVLVNVAIGFLIHQYATKNLDQQITHSPLDLMRCRCCYHHPAPGQLPDTGPASYAGAYAPTV